LNSVEYALTTRSHVWPEREEVEKSSRLFVSASEALVGLTAKGDSIIMADGSGRSGEAHRCRTLAEVLQVLNGPIRCEILVLLALGERDVSGISQLLDLDMATVSHNLTMLRRRGLVHRREEHRRHLYAHASCVRAAKSGEHIEVTITAQDGGAVTLRTNSTPQRKK
jgi:DNA-binding transcriptional ArsR family regulator